jgi:thioesterase domain-containing protein/acyl carrier protein
VILEELPVRGSGKIDPKDLPRPETVGDEKNYVAPRTEVEKKLAGIWEELLGARQVGIHDNFFELGGHSLLVMQLMVEVQQLFGINISLQDVFMAPTLAEFTDVLKRGDLKIKHKNLIPIRPAGTEAPLFMVHSVGGGIDYIADLAPFFNAAIPIFGLQANGFAPGQEPLKTVEEMAELYLDSIRQVRPQGPYRLAGWSAGGIIAYEMARRLIEMGEQVEFLGLLDTNYSQPVMPAKDFDPRSEMIDILSALLHKEDLDGIIQLAQTCDFETLFQGSSHAIDKIAKQFPSIPMLDASAVRRALAIQHAIRTAVYNYSLVRLPLSVWLFEATGNRPTSAAVWRSFLGDDIKVVPVQGTHATMVEGLENLNFLGGAITEALAAKQHIDHLI